MELRPPPVSPSPKHFRLASAAASPPYATAPSSPRGRLVVPAAEEAAAGGPFLTAPPSPNPFDLLPPATPRLTGGNPFDLFHHFTSAPASPRRAAAIYAHFADGNGDDDEEDGFQPRGSYATGGGSSVPFEWEERPGTPKRGLGAEAAAWEDSDFEFGTVAADKAALPETLTTADELFEKGKIRPLKPQLMKTGDEPKVRPLKPPPGLLDGGSVASSPRSPAMARGAGMWSPRRRSRVGSGVDFDPFAAALLEATKAPSPLGGKEEANGGGGVAPGSPAKKVATRPAASRSGAGWRRWRLSDLLLFRSSSDGGHVSKQEPIFKPAEQLDAPVKKAIAAQPGMMKMIKANGKGDDTSKTKNQHANRSAAAAAESVAGCARLSPLQRLAKGLGAYPWHIGRGMAAPASKG
ncbi:hypothetical protein HU200_057413 [Digitaria exilis]|uniref:Uncharacterized protein n=1 Tax=Digitaria exilis TaxID=1010633 RepID=A0A835E1H7_9POAL|nr:hypothetical protein HU200_057413 [Digitaria exilis]CAB3467465.1 unnamed protein product [Digitaria exilis]